MTIDCAFAQSITHTHRSGRRLGNESLLTGIPAITAGVPQRLEAIPVNMNAAHLLDKKRSLQHLAVINNAIRVVIGPMDWRHQNLSVIKNR